jgi:hypothetical protein
MNLFREVEKAYTGESDFTLNDNLSNKIIINLLEFDNKEFLNDLITTYKDIKLISRFKLNHLNENQYSYEPYDLNKVVKILPLSLIKSNRITTPNLQSNITYRINSGYLFIKPDSRYTQVIHNEDLTLMGYISVLMNPDNLELGKEFIKIGKQLFKKNLLNYIKYEF